MSYFPCDIPFMSDEELKANGIKIHKDTETTDISNADDLISRNAAIDAADRADYTGLAIEDVKKVTDEVVKELKRLPPAQPEVLACGEGELSAQPEREKGHWIDKTDPDWDGEWDDWQCSCCGSLITSMARNLNGLYLYCPNCGADMRGEN